MRSEVSHKTKADEARVRDETRAAGTESGGVRCRK